MSLRPIDNLPAVTPEELTDNDLLLVCTPDDTDKPTKKILAKEAFSGGGGGDSNVERLEITVSGTTASTIKTAAEIEALYESGKMIYACTNIGAYALIHFGLFATPETTGDVYLLCGGVYDTKGGIMPIILSGSSADAPLSAQISG